MSKAADLIAQPLPRRHLRVGWWSLALFVALGLVLEALHGFKVGFYLDVDLSTRRLMWTLAHAHGTLLGLVNVAFAWSVGHSAKRKAASLRLASWALLGATLTMPLGFFLGGLDIRGGDPGLGVLLVALGGLLLLCAVVMTAAAVSEKRGP